MAEIQQKMVKWQQQQEELVNQLLCNEEKIQTKKKQKLKLKVKRKKEKEKNKDKKKKKTVPKEINMFS